MSFICNENHIFNMFSLNMHALYFLITIFSISSANISNFTEFYKEIEDLIKVSKTFRRVENNDEYFKNFDCQRKPLDYGNFDFIIVGAGTAGGVVANRLTETNFTVLLVEAGPPDPDSASIIALGRYFPYSPLDWGYNTTEQNNSCLANIDKRCLYARGKMWGGSSSINGGVYTRGSKYDYDLWAKLVGNNDWSYDNVLPYFKKSEKSFLKIDIDKSYHGFSGPQGIDILEDTPGLTKYLIKACKESGLKELDYNGKTQYGFSRTQNYLDGNIRSGTAHAYIRPAADRRNLVISDNSLVTKVIIENNRAVGIEFMKNGVAYIACASKEVILSAGAINTPQILMLSGIGPLEELNKLGIKVIKDLPVGKNLLDHVSFSSLIFRSNRTYYNFTLKEKLKLWYQNKRPLTAGWGTEIISYKNLKNDEFSRPDMEITIGLAPKDIISKITKADSFNKDNTDTDQIRDEYSDITFLFLLLHPESKGEVTLQSKDPRDFPLINFNTYSVEKDLEVMYQSIQWLLKISKTKAFKSLNTQRLNISVPVCDEHYKIESKKWWYCTLKYASIPSYHAIGSAQMGTDPRCSVIDTELKVHGLQGLRIVDASIFPVSISGHMNAPTVMAAEKVSDLIKTEHLH